MHSMILPQGPGSHSVYANSALQYIRYTLNVLLSGNLFVYFYQLLRFAKICNTLDLLRYVRPIGV